MLQARRLAWVAHGNASDPAHRLWAICARLCLVAALVLLWRAWHLSAHKAYSIDEFFYVHVAWGGTQGARGLLELFTERGTFVAPVMWIPAVLLGNDDPANMIYVRLSMFPMFLVTLGCAMFVAARHAAHGRRALIALACAVLFLSARQLVWHILEVRPDGVAIMFTMLAVALLHVERLGPRLAAAASGLCVFLACLTTLKAVVYCLPFGAVFLADMYALRARRPTILRSPLWFAGGFAIGAALLALLLALNHALGSFWDGYYGHIAAHQKYYPTGKISRFLKPFFRSHPVHWSLAGIGLVATVARAATEVRRARVAGPPVLLILLLGSAWLSFLLQKAPWAYSLIPGAAMLSLFGALGVGAMLDLASVARREQRWLVGAFVAVALLIGTLSARYRMEPKHRNARQIAVQRMIHALVPPGDSVYDMSAAYVYRPRGHRFAIVGADRVRRFRDTLPDEVSRSLIANETMVWVYDGRFHGNWRKGALGRFFKKHYQRLNNDLYVWGRKWRLSRKDPAIDDELLALKQGDYFVHPPEAVRSGQLEIDGRRIDSRVFALDKGAHQVRYQGRAGASDELYIIWLPRGYGPFDPTRDHPRYELAKRILP